MSASQNVCTARSASGTYQGGPWQHWQAPSMPPGLLVPNPGRATPLAYPTCGTGTTLTWITLVSVSQPSMPPASHPPWGDIHSTTVSLDDEDHAVVGQVDPKGCAWGKKATELLLMVGVRTLVAIFHISFCIPKTLFRTKEGKG